MQLVKSSISSRFEAAKFIVDKLRSKGFSHAKMQKEHPALYEKYRYAITASNNHKHTDKISWGALAELAALVELKFETSIVESS